MLTDPEGLRSHPATSDRINEALLSSADPAISEAEREESVKKWSTAVDELPNGEHRAAFAEAAATYAAISCSTASELLRRAAHEKMTHLKSSGADRG